MSENIEETQQDTQQDTQQESNQVNAADALQKRIAELTEKATQAELRNAELARQLAEASLQRQPQHTTQKQDTGDDELNALLPDEATREKFNKGLSKKLEALMAPLVGRINQQTAYIESMQLDSKIKANGFDDKDSAEIQKIITHYRNKGVDFSVDDAIAWKHGMNMTAGKTKQVTKPPTQQSLTPNGAAAAPGSKSKELTEEDYIAGI